MSRPGAADARGRVERKQHLFSLPR